MRIAKQVRITVERFSVKTMLFHYGAVSREEATAAWGIHDPQGAEIAAGTLPAADIVLGAIVELGLINIDIAPIKAPTKLDVAVSIKNTEFKNRWRIWVYPVELDIDPPANVHIETAWG